MNGDSSHHRSRISGRGIRAIVEILLALALMAAPGSAVGQANGVIAGWVTDGANGYPVEAASIEIDGVSRVATDRESGAETVSRRRYLEVLVRRQDGHWYIFRDLDNELPPPADP